MARIRVVGRDQEIDAPEGTSLLTALLGAQSPISTSCGGQATCGLCRLTVVQGQALLTPVNAKEVNHLGNVAKVVNIRLACQAVVVGDGDIELDVPALVDIAARKREQTRRGFAERASRRRSVPGSAPGTQAAPEDRPSRVPEERIEWRPRKLNPQPGDTPEPVATDESPDPHRRPRRRS
jgi:ferredoxin